MPNNNHPHIQALHELYQEEKQAFRKVHRMIDLFESIIKTYTVVILSEYIKQSKLSDSAKGLLSQGLRTPSLGTWQLFSRVLFEELQKDNYAWLVGEFPKEFLSLDKALNNEKTNVIALRNGYAHGATPTDAQCEVDIKKFEPFLTQLVESKWLGTSSLEVRDNKVYLVASEEELSLHPILLYRNEESAVSFAFFNDIKNDKIGLLNYPLSKHYREKDFYTEFHEHLPLNEWKKSGNNEFYQRIEELTETFKGRTAEREQLLRFVEDKNKGYFSIQGNPGIGKSALIAQFFKDLRVNEKLKHIQVVEYFIRRGTAQANTDYLLNYLIKRTDELFPQGREIRAEDKNTWSLQQQLFSKWRLWAEHSKGNKLLFLIDGLDEGVEDDIIKYLPRENFENVLIIYGSRPGGHRNIDELWTTLPTEYHTKLELNGLSKQDIRALIYEVANKYVLERESAWIDAVEKRSQGNPLYLKLLCDALENGSIELNDIKAIPKEIDQFYKEIIGRYAKDTLDGDALLAALYTFAAAKDYLTMAHLGLINKLGEAQVERVGSTLKEVLYENPLTEEVLDYQLFHESFREYLVKEKNKQVLEAAERIIDFCANWQELEGVFEQRYALENYAPHLSESKKELRHKELLALFQNEVYTTTQKKVLKQFDTTKKLYQLGLLKAGEVKVNDAQLEAALCLVDLKYEEANDAPQIVALVANNEIDLALKRIESFGGNNKKGLRRKSILYMLCLMELTLLDSKDKPFRKSAIDRLLNHLDEKLPIDHSIFLRWDDFFPSYTVFLMACECAEMGLDYLIVYKRTYYWENDWLKEKGLFTDIQFEVLLECARSIINDEYKSKALKDISAELVKQGKIEEAASAMQEALECAPGISDDRAKSRALKEISAELVKQGKIEEAASTMQEALECARGISNDVYKSKALKDISAELAKQGEIVETASAMQEALLCARGISNDEYKSKALKDISEELVKQGKIVEAASAMQEALECARGISNDVYKSKALKEISAELVKQGKIEEAASTMQEALECARGISSDDIDKSWALKDISAELAKQGKIVEAASVMQETLECARGTSNTLKSYVLKDISSELAKQGKIIEALECARVISNDEYKSKALKDISAELAKQGNTLEALECALGISDYIYKSNALKDISAELAKQGMIKEALECARGISGDSYKSSALTNISAELAKQGKNEEAASAMQEALECARGIGIDRSKSNALKDISAELAKQGKNEEAASAMQEALECARGISNDYDKSKALKDISAELAKQWKVEEALECARGISDDFWKRKALNDISAELVKQGKIEEAASAMQEALECARGISTNGYNKSNALTEISAELAKQGDWQLAESTSMEITQLAKRQYCWQTIAHNTCKEMGWEKALQQVNQFKSDEAQLFYLKGWAHAVDKKETDSVCVQAALSQLVYDSESIETLLQKHALNQLFFGSASKEQINRLNKTLNIQWAIDIKNQFPSSEEIKRLSTNVEAWLHEIADEDDRDDIADWAKRVTDGKWTEEKFQEKIQEKLK